jgi:major membrane immunogen (membrane-anchored lipoprotein)
MYRRCFGLMAMMGLVAIVGCGSDDGLGDRYAVKGKVTYKGEPLKQGKISFYPVTPDPKGINSGAFGNIENGTYSLSTRGDDDGAFPGEYTVSIVARDVDMSKAAANVKGGVFKQDDVSKAYRTAKSLIPQKYEVAETSGLKASVKSSSNSIDFELTD